MNLLHHRINICVFIFIYFYLHSFLIEDSDLSTTLFLASSSSLSSLSSLPPSLILQLQMSNITSHSLRLKNVAYMKKEPVEKIMIKIGGTGKGSSSSSFSLETPTL